MIVRGLELEHSGKSYGKCPNRPSMSAVGAKGFYPDALEIDEPHGQRWAAALELLATGPAKELVVAAGHFVTVTFLNHDDGLPSTPTFTARR